MRRATWILILLVAFSLAAEPLLHTHPLNHSAADLHSSLASDSGLPCAICATAAAPSIPAAPSLEVPVTDSWSLCVRPVAKLARLAHADLSSRAPPSV